MFLYNIADDPDEEDEVSVSHPEIVITLLERLQAYNATSVPALDPPSDPEGIEKVKETGAWLPWK